jgi:predicted nucleotidyltransferase
LSNLRFDQKKLNKLSQDLNLSLVILFGSCAGGDKANQESDIDIGVVAKEKEITSCYEINLIKTFTHFFKSGKIDLVILNHVDSLLLYEVACQGILLFEDQEGRFNSFKVEAFKKHNDGKKFYKLDEIYVHNFLKRTGTYDQHPPSLPKVKKIKGVS